MRNSFGVKIKAHEYMWPSTTKGTSCRPDIFGDNEQNSV